MAVDLEKLVVSLEANLKQYERELAKANKTTVTALRGIEKSAQASVGRIEKTFGSVGASFKANVGLLAAGAVAGLAAMARTAVQDAAAIGDLSDKLGLGTAELQGLQYGAVQANMSFEDLSGGLLKFSKTLGQARNGQGELLKTLEANGFTKAQIQALSYSDALGKVADLVKNARSEQDAMLIITQAFGKGGDGFLEFLRNGSSGLGQFQADVQSAGGVIDDALIRKAQELDDRWAALMQSMKTQTQSAVLTIIDALSSIPAANGPGPDMIQTRYGYRPRSVAAGGTPNIPLTPGAPGKGDFNPTPTKIFNPEDDAAAAAATRAKAAADSAAASAAKQRADAIKNVVDALTLENTNLKTNELQQRINTELAQANVSATSAQGKQIAALVTANYNLEASQRLNTLALSNYADRLEEVKSAQMELAQMGTDAFKRIAFGGEKAKDVMLDLAKSLADAAFNAAFLGQGPLATLFGMGTGGGLIGSLLGGLTGGGSVGLYAKGGQVPSGRLGIVGEAGPELIRGPAQVTPMSKVSGGGTTTVQIHVSLSGANGNAEVERIAREGVQRGLREFARQQPAAQVERNLRVA